jgi:hypothetical protein
MFLIVKKIKIFFLKFITDANYKNPTRICAMNFLNVLIETQKAVNLIIFCNH